MKNALKCKGTRNNYLLISQTKRWQIFFIYSLWKNSYSTKFSPFFWPLLRFITLPEFMLVKLICTHCTHTSTKARIFPRRFSTFLTFWCKIRSNRNEASLYPRRDSYPSLYPRLKPWTLLYPRLTVAIATTPYFVGFLQRSSWPIG